MKRVLATAGLIILASFVIHAQQTAPEAIASVKSTSAYSMLLFKKLAVEADLQEALESYTTDYPSVRLKQFEIHALNREMEKMNETVEANWPKLTSAYGTLILQKAKLKSELQSLLVEYTADYPLVKRKRAEFNLLVQEIAKIFY